MRFRTFQSHFAALLFALIAASSAAAQARGARAPEACPNGGAFVLVVPFVNEARADSHDVLSLAFAAHVAEALETDPCIRPIVGDETTLLEEAARLVTPQGTAPKGGLLPAANALALRLGATHFLYGSYSGWVEDWEMEADLCQVNATGSASSGFRCVSGYAYGSLMDHARQSATLLHGQLATAVSHAFEAGTKIDAGPIAAETIGRIGTSPSVGTTDFYAELLLGRAYRRLFLFERPQQREFASLKTWQTKAAFIRRQRRAGKHDSALGLADAAVRIDPKYVAAQRLYAALAARSVVLKNPVMSARLHYEAALASDPRDYRSLLALGALEADDKHPDVARGYFIRAAAVRPAEPAPAYAVGLASLKLGDSRGAIAWFEHTRDIAPGRSDARRALAALYAASGRYADGAKEYAEVTRRDLTDLEARFAEAALSASAGDLDRAVGIYGAMCEQRGDALAPPMQAAACKFAGDVSRKIGRNPAAIVRFYVRAGALDPQDRRTKAILEADLHPPLGGDALQTAIAEAAEVSAKVETVRVMYQAAQNDAVLDLRLNGGAGCKDGGGASSALLADDQATAHAALRTRLTSLVRDIGAALRSGEGRAMTPDRIAAAQAAEVRLRTSGRDASELRAQHLRAFLPLYQRYRCASYDGELHEATFDAVQARNGARLVPVPDKVRDPGAPMYFSPTLAADVARSVFIGFDNREGHDAYDISVVAADKPDGGWQKLGTVAPGRQAELPVRIGLYRVCVVPHGAACSDEDLQRLAYLHDGWKMRIRQPK